MATDDFTTPLSVCVYHPAAIYPFLHGNNLRQRADGKHSHRYCRSGQYCLFTAITRNISAVPTFKVTRHFVNEEAARKAVQKKEIYGYLSIPPKFEQDAISGKNATLSYYYHYALLSVGGELMAAFETSLAPVSLSPIVMQAVALGVNQTRSRHSCCPYKPAITLYTIRVWIIRFI